MVISSSHNFRRTCSGYKLQSSAATRDFLGNRVTIRIPERLSGRWATTALVKIMTSEEGEGEDDDEDEDMY
ncbi:hypothetical protein AMELA_G00273020 [Ameiurus melas]|uniref:Uncharacterized protein n=1 Tax=Ameiurus melas TaxID=219545 RepID=A0A7J5ZL25_AMEME|nr:hypothetical protein AMELA_G00273020 [Ameiurus melas]